MSRVEIERKFLVAEVPDGLERSGASEIRQGYLAVDGEAEVRVRRRDDAATLTVKRGAGRAREEAEIEIDAASFETLWPLTLGRRVEKTRHLVPTDGGLTIELDVYSGALRGLVVAEVEFDDDDQARAFAPPAWLGAEVTEDPRFKNQALARDGAPPPPRPASP